MPDASWCFWRATSRRLLVPSLIAVIPYGGVSCRSNRIGEQLWSKFVDMRATEILKDADLREMHLSADGQDF